MGDIGNARRMEFAMLGDTVNVAFPPGGGDTDPRLRHDRQPAGGGGGGRRYLAAREFPAEDAPHQGLLLRGRNEGADVGGLGLPPGFDTALPPLL